VVDNPSSLSQEQLEAKQDLAEKVQETLNALDNLTQEIALENVYVVYISDLNKSVAFTDSVEAKSVWYDYCKRRALDSLVTELSICRTLDEFDEWYTEEMRKGEH